MTLIQIAAPDLGDLLIKGAAFVLAGGVSYMGHEVRKLGKGMGDLKTELAEWRVVLFGYTGDNGLNGDMKDLKQWRIDHERRHSGGRRHYDPEEPIA